MDRDSAARIDEEACRWVMRIDRGLADAERAELDLWLRRDERRRGALLRAQAAWSVLDRGPLPGWGANEPESESAADSGLAADDGRFRTRRQLLRLGGGAAAALAVGGLWAFWPSGERVATTLGEMRRLPLEDGSLAVLNSGSGLRVLFTDARRDIELNRGEVWFKVAKNPERPFTVVAGSVHVLAVGTEFNVRRYGDRSEVMVTEGVVQIWSAATGDGPLLAPAGSRVRIGDGQGVDIASLSAADMEQRLAWREGRIVLDGMTMAAAAAEFNRYNDTKLVIDPAFADRRVVGWFRFDDLEGFVGASTTLVGGRAERGDGFIRIAP